MVPVDPEEPDGFTASKAAALSAQTKEKLLLKEVKLMELVIKDCVEQIERHVKESDRCRLELYVPYGLDRIGLKVLCAYFRRRGFKVRLSFWAWLTGHSGQYALGAYYPDKDIFLKW
jgi:hypothetical protein